MRSEPTEIGLAHKVARRREVERIMRSSMAARRAAADAKTPRACAFDEAFADMPQMMPAKESGDGDHRASQLSLVAQLAEQLQALDRQREQLARLLQDVEDTALVE